MTGKFKAFLDRQKEGIKRAQDKRIIRSAGRQERVAQRETERFETESKRLERQEALETRRARIRKQQAISRPKGTSTGGRASSAFGSFQDFATDFSKRQSALGPSVQFGPSPARKPPLKRRMKARKKRKKR